MKKVQIYTDGACSGNPGKGGYGAVLIYGSVEKEISGFELETTNNRMELLAVIKALECLKYPCEIQIYSDSAYVVNPFLLGWIDTWQSTEFKQGKIKNQDLWLKLLDLLKPHKFIFIKVKGHSDNAYNNKCDLLATSAIKQMPQ